MYCVYPLTDVRPLFLAIFVLQLLMKFLEILIQLYTALSLHAQYDLQLYFNHTKDSHTQDHSTPYIRKY